MKTVLKKIEEKYEENVKKCIYQGTPMELFDIEYSFVDKSLACHPGFSEDDLLSFRLLNPHPELTRKIVNCFGSHSTVTSVFKRVTADGAYREIIKEHYGDFILRRLLKNLADRSK